MPADARGQADINAAEVIRAMRRRPCGGSGAGQPAAKLSRSWSAVEVPDVTQPAASMRFADFELQPLERRLLAAGNPVPLGARAFDVLLALAARAGQLVTKNELLDLVWPGLVVEENNLATQVSNLRKVLGGEIIATIPGRGYRFTAALLAPPTEAPVPAPPALRSNLREKPAQLIGRDDDLTALRELLEQHGLVTIVGAGGIGKSSLARALLQQQRSRHAHGVCWVELAPLPATDALPQRLPATIASALGVRLAGGDTLAALAAAVAPLDMALVLDNAEHLPAAVATVVEALRQAAPRVRLLVTSQAPLRARGEHLYRLGALAWPQGRVDAAQAMAHGAVALFVHRARALDRHFALDDANVQAVVSLCRALDGLPLAIELAATRLPLLGLPALAAALDQRLRLLTVGAADAPTRQKTLRAALEWSHSLLTPHEQAVMRRLAVFAGSASLPMAQQVAADEAIDAWGVLDAMGGLVDRSLLAAGTDGGDSPRYRLLDTPRSFALERLAASGESGAVRARHAAAVRERFERAQEERWSGRVGLEAWLEDLQLDVDNAREAFAWAREHDPACAVALCAGLLAVLPESQHAERLAIWQAAEPLFAHDDVPSRLRADALIEAADKFSSVRHAQARRHAEEAVERFRALGDRFMLYRCLARLARLAAPEDAPAAEQALAEMRNLEQADWPAARLLLGAGAEQACASWFHDPQRGLAFSYRLIALEREARSGTLHGLLCVVDIELELRHAAEALRTGLELVSRLEGTRHRGRLNIAQLNLVEAWLASDEPAQARALALVGWPEAAAYAAQASWADSLALLAAMEGRPRASALLLGYADARYAATQNTRQVAEGITVERAEQSARRFLGEAEFGRLKAEGAALRDADIPALAFAEQDAGAQTA